MITTGIIRQINKNSDENHISNIFAVELPIFETPANKTDDDFIIDCTACTVPGMFNVYKPGDTVYIGFINNEFNDPVILGKIYKGTNDPEVTGGRGLFNASSIDLSSSIVLAPEATVNGTSVEYLSTLINQAKSYFTDLQTSQRYIHEIRLVDNIVSPHYSVGVDITNNQSKVMDTVADLFSQIQITNTPTNILEDLIPFYPARGFINTSSVIGLKIKKEEHRYLSHEDDNSTIPPTAEAWSEILTPSEWDNNTTYNEFDVVKYSDEDYIALDESTNVTPTDTTKWKKIEEILFYNPKLTYDKYSVVQTYVKISLLTIASDGTSVIEDLDNGVKLYYTYANENKSNVPRITF